MRPGGWQDWPASTRSGSEPRHAMTVEAAIEPAATPSIRPTATRVLVVTAVYVVAVVAAAIYPLVSPLRYAGFDHRRRPAGVRGERRGLAGRAPDRVRSPARGPALEVDLRVVAGEPDLRLQLRAGLPRVEHRPTARDPRDRRVRAPRDRVSDGQPAQPVRSRRRAVRLRAPRRAGAARPPVLGSHGRLRAGLRP